MKWVGLQVFFGRRPGGRFAASGGFDSPIPQGDIIASYPLTFWEWHQSVDEIIWSRSNDEVVTA